VILLLKHDFDLRSRWNGAKRTSYKATAKGKSYSDAALNYVPHGHLTTDPFRAKVDD
jgi:hypothetical protein